MHSSAGRHLLFALPLALPINQKRFASHSMVNNESRFHPGAGAPPRPRPRASRRGPATSHDKTPAPSPPPQPGGNLWPWASSKIQLHIVPECLRKEKIITFSNCSVGGPGSAPDKEGLAGVRRARSGRVLPDPHARLSLFVALKSQPSSPWACGNQKKILKGGKRGEKQRVKHWE